jgi:uncharacterized protein
MLELRPICEHCAAPLDPTGDEARICTYECTFCARCATWELLGVCPNCDGELVTRPRRPRERLAKDLAGTTPKHRPVDLEVHHAKVVDRLARGDLPTQVWTVAFCNGRPADSSGDGYQEKAAEMDTLAAQQPGFLGVDSVRSDGGEGITVSRWSSIAAMISWRRVAAHQEAQRSGVGQWYEWYRSDVARVDRTSEFRRSSQVDSSP